MANSAAAIAAGGVRGVAHRDSTLHSLLIVGRSVVATHCAPWLGLPRQADVFDVSSSYACRWSLGVAVVSTAVRSALLFCQTMRTWPNKPDAANPAIASLFKIWRHWRGVADPGR